MNNNKELTPSELRHKAIHALYNRSIQLSEESKKLLELIVEKTAAEDSKQICCPHCNALVPDNFLDSVIVDWANVLTCESCSKAISGSPADEESKEFRVIYNYTKNGKAYYQHMKFTEEEVDQLPQLVKHLLKQCESVIQYEEKRTKGETNNE